MDSELPGAIIAIEDDLWVGDPEAAKDEAGKVLERIPDRSELNKQINATARRLGRDRKRSEVRKFLDSEFGRGGRWIDGYQETILRNRVARVYARLTVALNNGVEPIARRHNFFRFSIQSIGPRHIVRVLFDSKMRKPEPAELTALASSLGFSEPSYDLSFPSVTIRMFSGEEYIEASFVERYGSLTMVQRNFNLGRVSDVAVALFELFSSAQSEQ